jgi:hypothetical protein
METATELRYRPGTSDTLNIKVKLNWLEGQINFCSLQSVCVNELFFRLKFSNQFITTMSPSTKFCSLASCLIVFGRVWFFFTSAEQHSTRYLYRYRFHTSVVM